MGIGPVFVFQRQPDVGFILKFGLFVDFVVDIVENFRNIAHIINDW